MASKQNPIKLTNPQARRFFIWYQGLYPPRQLAGKAGVMEFISRVGCIQYDPLNIAGRNPDLVLQSRVAGYQPGLLDEMLYKDRVLVDYWDKMMAIFPTEDWPYFARTRESSRLHWRGNERELEALMPYVRQQIETRGPLSSIEIDLNEKMDWSWGPTRAARAVLEKMYHWGDLVIHHKVNTRKVYDLTERHIPTDILAAHDPHLSDTAYEEWRVLRRVGGFGLIWARAGDPWLAIGIKIKTIRETIARLVAQGRLTEVQVEGLNETCYMRTEDVPLLELMPKDLEAPGVAFIAALDNVMWARDFVEALFGFYYRWEVYTPAPKRVYGYYVLPVIYGDWFVARFEPKREIKKGKVTVKNWWWEDGVQVDAAMKAALQKAFSEFCQYLEVEKVEFAKEAKEMQYLAD